MSRPTQITIDLAAVRHNLQRVHSLAPGRSVIAMIKANAYGHGLVPIAQALQKADAFGVASLEEALLLRKADITKPIVLMEGLFHRDELEAAAQQEMTLVVHHAPQLEMLKQMKPAKPFPVWLKINTGMHRLGINPAEFQSYYAALAAMDSVKKPIGLMTHFAEAELLESPATLHQLNAFKSLIESHQGPCSLANSAAIIAWPDSHADWVRPGLMLYGASPFANQTGATHELQPVMTFESRLIAITQVKRGGKVGYDGTWSAPEDMLVGVVGVGYGDGYPQFAANGTPLLVNNQKCPLVGRVSMDMLTVDLRDAPHAKISDPVILWGEGLPVEEVATHCRTSAYEILTRMTPRPKLVVKD